MQKWLQSKNILEIRTLQKYRLGKYNHTFFTKKGQVGDPLVAQQVKNLTSIHQDASSIPGLAHWVKDLALPQAAAGMGHRCDLDPVLLWLWYRSADTVPIQPLAWELPYATNVALKKKRKKKRYKLLENQSTFGGTEFWELEVRRHKGTGNIRNMKSKAYNITEKCILWSYDSK